MAKRKKVGKKSRDRVSKSISKKVREGIPQEQAIAESLSMARKGRLTKEGDYIRAKRGRKRSR